MCGWLRRGRLRAMGARVRNGIEASFDDDQPPAQIAGSFALGVFLTTLPTLGVNLVLMIVLAARSKRVNTVALFASGMIINPLVKWGIYALSVPLGILLLGPLEGGVALNRAMLSNRPLIVRLLVGNLILAVGCTAISYVVIRWMIVVYRERELAVVETAVEAVIDEIDDVVDGKTGGDTDDLTDGEITRDTGSSTDQRED